MIEPKKIIVDTSAWVEYTLEGELYHTKVRDYFTGEIENGSKIFTTDYVLDEAYTRLLTGQGLRAARILRDKVRESENLGKLLILWMDENLFAKAWDYFAKFAEHNLSFTDATIVTFVKDLKLSEVLSLDQGFEKVGLTVKPRLI